MARIVIDPITRIEGHLRVEVEVEGGKVRDAWTSGTLFRGYEIIARDRDPRDVWQLTQRICGVCPTSHAHTSSIGFDDAFKVKPPDNGRIIRNIIEGAQFVHSHILWFYHLTALDYVNVVSALKASTKGAPYLKATQDRLKKFVESGQLGIFANAYWEHPAYSLPPEINLLAVAHYLEAIDMQAKASHVSAMFGGRMPMTMTSPPGGVMHYPSAETIAHYLPRVQELKDFIDNKFIPDVLAVAPYYLEYAKLGRGPANYLAWGVFEDASFDPKKRLLPAGVIFADSPAVEDAIPLEVTEHVRHSWYKDSEPLNPSVGVTEPEFTELDTQNKYSWAKSPRYQGKPMETGALARMLVAYLSGQPTARKLIDSALSELGQAGNVEILKSVVGRIAARALECKMVADAMYDWGLELVENMKKGDLNFYTPHEIPDRGSGIGLWEAPRGALGHWNQIEGRKVKNYQVITPTAWNVSPRDDNGVPGPIEQALVGTPVIDPKRPLEILRVVHSFDPCLACTVHVIDPWTNERYKFRV